MDASWNSVVAGPASSCGIATDHRAWCWGNNAFGVLGDGTTAMRLLPTPVVGPI